MYRHFASTREDRTLLSALAQCYLVEQRRLWPELANNAYLPEPSSSVLEAMADSYVRRFSSEEVDTLHPTAGDLPCEGMGAVYLRVSLSSCARSLPQQLRRGLQKASENEDFVPWQYLFFEISAGGRSKRRGGYRALQSLLLSDFWQPRALYIDSLGRAKRDLHETIELVEIIKVHHRRIITADGFDSLSTDLNAMLVAISLAHDYLFRSNSQISAG